MTLQNSVFNRPNVAGAALETPVSVILSLIDSVTRHPRRPLALHGWQAKQITNCASSHKIDYVTQVYNIKNIKGYCFVLVYLYWCYYPPPPPSPLGGGGGWPNEGPRNNHVITGPMRG